MTATLENPITDEEIIAEIAKNPLKIEWDQNDRIQPEDLYKIVSGGQEALDEYTQELVDLNQEGLWRMERELQLSLESRWSERDFLALDEDASPTDKTEHLEALIQEHGSPSVDVKRLAKLTGRQHFAIRACEHIYFQAYRGIDAGNELDEVLELLQISPHHYQDLVTPDSGIILPEIPEREGKNFVDIEGFRKVLQETMYGGNIVFLCGMPTEDVIENLADFHTKNIIVKKGTWVMFNDYMNGAPSCADTPLLKDLTIPHGKGHLYYDGGDSRGVQACCQMTEKPWVQGHAFPEPSEN